MSRCLGYSLQGRSGVCFGFCLGAHDDRIWRSSGVAAWKLADSSRTEAISQLGPPTRHARFSNVRSSAIGSPIDQRWSGPLSISNSGTLASWACCAAAASSFDLGCAPTSKRLLGCGLLVYSFAGLSIGRGRFCCPILLNVSRVPVFAACQFVSRAHRAKGWSDLAS